jgi:signal transduction histidine kinase
VIYAAGPAFPLVRRSTAIASLWLALLAAAWLALLSLTPDAVWLAFPLFFVELHLLPVRSGIAAVAATAVAAIVGFAWHQHSANAGMVIGPLLGAAVAVATVLGYQALYRESERRRQLIEQLTATRADLAAAERAAGVAGERERLAREIHDTLAQGLSSIQLLLRAAERLMPDRSDPARAHVRRAREAAVDNLAEARRFVRALAPPDLETGSLRGALRRLCERVSEPDLTARFRVSGSATELPTAHEAALLRIAQSALANVVQHAKATQVEATLSYMETEVALDIVDNGVGFAVEAAPDAGSGFGLAAMRARAVALGGDLAVESAPGRGTAVAARIPVSVAQLAQA